MCLVLFCRSGEMVQTKERTDKTKLLAWIKEKRRTKGAKESSHDVKKEKVAL